MKRFVLIWFYEAGFKSGERVEYFDTLEEAEKYMDENKNKEAMIDPAIYEKVKTCK